MKKETPPAIVESLLQSTTQLLQATNISKKKPVCFGRVMKLEERVPEQWWKTVFSDSMYLKTDGDVVEDPEITKQELEEIINTIPELKSVLGKARSSHDKNASKILDLCCGQGRHSLQLMQDYPHLKVHGHDQSSYLISLAKERAKTQKVDQNTQFTVGDCREIPYKENEFDIVLLLGNSFGYFSSEDQDRAVLREIQRVLKPNGTLVIDLTDGEYMRNNFSEKSWEWIDDTTFVVRERQLSDDRTRLISREIITLTNKGVVRDQFYQERLYSQSELYKLLEDCQYCIPEDKIEMSLFTKSKRNEDLGMMGNRMIISCKKIDVNVYTETNQVAAKQDIAVTLLLGDPSQPCIGKLNDQWNQQDIDTQQKLIDALKKQLACDISIQTNHGHLIENLLTNPPQFVFNLCDEGWNNDALKELHIPALLEMLDIPYSGAGPNCLAFCYDKGMVNRSASAIGIETPKEVTYCGGDKEILYREVAKMGYPAFVKPIKGDNSLGITTRSVVHSELDLKMYLEELESQQLNQVLVQEYLQGDEYGVGIIGNVDHGFHFFPTIRVNFENILKRDLPPILGYESKWDPHSPYWTEIKYEKAELDEAVQDKLRLDCIQLWKRFSCVDYCRFDFRADKNGKLKLLEVNTNPGWCWDGKFACMAKLQGLEYHEMLQKILEASWKRLGMS